MHDLNQIAKDAERVEASAKAWLSECEGLDRDEIEYHESERRLAAFARDLTDETPADADWLDSIYPPADEGWERFQVYKNGSCYFSSRDVGSTFIGVNVTRGRVRAFAFGVGLTLREGEG